MGTYRESRRLVIRHPIRASVELSTCCDPPLSWRANEHRRRWWSSDDGRRARRYYGSSREAQERIMVFLIFWGSSVLPTSATVAEDL